MNNSKIAYKYDNKTGEFVGEIDAYLDPEESAKADKEIYILPADSTFIEPPLPTQGLVNVFNGTAWITTPDFRGQTVYLRETGAPVDVTEIGALPADVTDITYPGRFYKWGGSDWVLDDTAKAEAVTTANKVEKSQLFDKASAMIKMYEEAERDGDILPDEIELLKNWRTYQRKINRITDLTQDVIDWPVRPE